MRNYNRYSKAELIDYIMRELDGIGYSKKYWKAQTKAYIVRAIVANL